MALIVKGHAVSFDLVNDKKIDAPARNGMIHDPIGRSWNKNSVLVGPYEKLGDEVDADKYERDYLGRSYVRAGDVRLPPKSLGEWESVGDVEKIYYTRHGERAGGKRFKHKMNEMSLARLFKGKGRAVLYRHGAWYRLELPHGAILHRAGFVWP